MEKAKDNPGSQRERLGETEQNLASGKNHVETAQASTPAPSAGTCMATSVKAPGLSWSWWTALFSHVSKHFSTNVASFTHSIETHDIEILPILMDKGQLVLTYATRWEPISFPANYCLIIHQAACRWIFSASSMKSELQCGAGLWKALPQLWSECLELSVLHGQPPSACCAE